MVVICTLSALSTIGKQMFAKNGSDLANTLLENGYNSAQSETFGSMHASAASAMNQHAYAPTYVAAPTHPAIVGYLLWLLGIFGAHRFYFGKPWTGVLWFFTGGLFLIGWIIDLFFIPEMAEQANQRSTRGPIDHTVAWCLHFFLGIFGIHRLYMGKIVTGIIYLLTGGLFGIGYIYDTLTLNEQVDELNMQAGRT